jgi:small GTP-binding protein
MAKKSLGEWFKRFKKNFEIVMIGLDNSGKTTIMNFLQIGEPFETVPTTGIEVKEFCLVDNIRFKIIDTAGQKQFRNIWDSYLLTADVVIFVLDVADTPRYEEARDEFEKIIKKLHIRKNGNKVPVLFAMNKIDLIQPPQTVDQKKWELLTYFRFKDFLEARNPYQIQPTCALTGEGLFDMIKWIFTTTTGKKLTGSINFEEFLIFENGKLLISKSSFINRNIDEILPGMMKMIISCVNELITPDFKIELNNRLVIFYHIMELTGVVVIPSSDDEIRAKTVLHDILDKLLLLNFREMDESNRKKLYNQIVVPQIIETQEHHDYYSS